MRITFRQGIVTHAESTGGQAFLQSVGGGGFDIIGDVTVAFAQRNADYLHVEVNTVAPAWEGVPTSGDAWLFWDIDTQSAVVTYGNTIVQPTSGSTEPTGVADLHWYDTANKTMFVFEGGKFVEKIRVFSARINGTSIFPLGSNLAKPFTGTQVGINQTTFAGQILFAEGLPVIISVSGVFIPGQILVGSPPRVTANPFARVYTFATTETPFLMGGSQKVNTIRLESDVVTAAADQNLGAYQVVKYNAAGNLELASYNDVESTTIGIVVDSHINGEIATVILQGKITNEQWNWPNVGAELFVETNGNLTETDPNLSTPSVFPVSKPPVARVLNSKEIIFMQGLGKVGPRGLNPESIGTIGDVTLTQPVTAGEVLQFIDEQWRNDRPLIDDLEDVLINTPLVGQSLVYVGSPLLWRNQFIGSPAPLQPDLADLNDVTVGSPKIGIVLYNDGTNWVTLPRGTAGQVLTMGSPLLPSWNIDNTVARLSTGSPLLVNVGDMAFDSTVSLITNGVETLRLTESVILLGRNLNVNGFDIIATAGPGSPNNGGIISLTVDEAADPGVGSNGRIEMNTSAGSPVFTSQLTFAGSSGSDTFVIDSSHPLTFRSGGEGNTLTIRTSSSDQDIVIFASGGNSNILLTSGVNADIILTGGTGPVAGTVALVGATGTTTSIGGPITLTGGAGAATSAGGLVSITAGVSGSGLTGNGGAVTISSGASLATDGDGGDVSITSGVGNGTGVDGTITLTADGTSVQIANDGVTFTGTGGILLNIVTVGGSPTAYTLQAADRSEDWIRFGGSQVNVPSTNLVIFPTGSQISIRVTGHGGSPSINTVTVVGSGSPLPTLTFGPNVGSPNAYALGSVIGLVYVGNNTWDVI